MSLHDILLVIVTFFSGFVLAVATPIARSATAACYAVGLVQHGFATWIGGQGTEP